MKPDSLFHPRVALIVLATMCSTPLAAQEVVAPPTPNADRLAEEMRTLARDPRNVRALLSAGEMSARLNDFAAAAGFFARAQALEPDNPRILAGQAMVMVRMERPGEALRLFAQAASRGQAMEAYASDRGLAYDLTGATAHALHEHRIAMRDRPDDETVRRYALSLGIAGRTQEAMTALDPLLRRSDRSAWRARAFILAMNGDAAGADKIAASTMGKFGTALSPFFHRLPTLSAADKAFAVHFGELRQTPARVADARMAPALPGIAAEPRVAVAAVEPQRPTAAPTTTRAASNLEESGRGAAARRNARAQQERERLAQQQTRERETAQRLADSQAAEARRQADLRAAQEREALAAQQRDTERVAAAQLAQQQQAAREAEARRVAEVEARERAAAQQAARQAETERLARAATPPPAPVSSAPVEVASAPPPPPPPSQSAPAPGFVSSGPTVATAPVETARVPAPVSRVGGEDNVIARIVAGITIPASELGVAPMPGREPEPTPEPVEAAPAPTPAPVEVARAPVEPAPKPGIERPKPDPAAAAKAKAAQAKAAEDRAARAKAAAEAKAAAAKLKADPARHWAQVAGGANVGALPREWARLLKVAPAEFRGRQAWTTPLRFTNRLLVGPFKTAGEAQDFVNAIGKKGLSAFAWTSEAGQKIEKLGGR